MTGFIKIHRTIEEHWLGDNTMYMGAWLSLLLMAQWKDGTKMVKGQPVKVKRGDLICSHRYLASRWDWSVGKVQRFIRLLAKEGMIATTRLDSGSQTITICNYEKYQSHESATDSGASQERVDLDSKKKEGKKERTNIHLTREMPVFGLVDPYFTYEGGSLVITDPKELTRWEGIFGTYSALSTALAGFTPDAEYRHGNSLDKHARHYLSNKASQTNRRVAPRPSLSDKFR